MENAVPITRDSITARIDAALEKMRWRQHAVRAICLNKVDLEALATAQAAGAYKGYPVIPAKHSKVYSKSGVQLSVPMLLSKRVAA